MSQSPNTSLYQNDLVPLSIQSSQPSQENKDQSPRSLCLLKLLKLINVTYDFEDTYGESMGKVVISQVIDAIKKGEKSCSIYFPMSKVGEDEQGENEQILHHLNLVFNLVIPNTFDVGIVKDEGMEGIRVTWL